jgi:tripartite-type tricarboxylate transporter receptor subunit TctC
MSPQVLELSVQRRHLLQSLGGASLGLAAPHAFAQDADFPSKIVKFIIPNAPGSSVDTIGRILGAQLAQFANLKNVVENKAGAAGAIGMESGKAAPADGYSLVIASSSSMSVAPLLQKSARYDALKDFDLISLVAIMPNVLVCTSSLKIDTVADLIAYCKANPGKVNMASAGLGSVSHLAGAAFAQAGGVESLHVPYKGGSQSVASVVSGETHWTLTPAPAAMSLVKAGRLKALGHSLSKGTMPLGAVPSIGQTLAGFEYASWIGVVAPRGLAPNVIAKLQKGLEQVLQQPSLRESFDVHGAIPSFSTSDAFRDFLTKDIALNRRVIRTVGMQAE